MAVHGATHPVRVSGWTVGFATFAGVLMLLGGFFQVFQGLTALFNGDFFVLGSNATLLVDVTTWGWIHTIVGAIVAFAGIGVFSGQAWARTTGIILAIISAVANFFYLPYYPFWAMVIIALDIAIIGALAAYGPRQAATGYE